MAENKVGYSKTDLLALKILKRSKKPVDTLQLVERIYKGREEPFHARQAVLVMMNSLQRKVEVNKEPFRIIRTERSGPKPISFWLADKK